MSEQEQEHEQEEEEEIMAKILLVEDNEMNRDMLTRGLLRSCSCSCSCSCSLLNSL
jgi:hypothetical protein